MKVITNIEQIFERNENGLQLVSQKIINDEVTQEDDTVQSKLLKLISTDIRYGIISLKNHIKSQIYTLQMMKSRWD